LSAHFPKVCATTVVCPPKTEEKAEEVEEAEVKAECAEVKMDPQVAETLRKSRLLLENVKK
jgi:hypothetical protein